MPPPPTPLKSVSKICFDDDDNLFAVDWKSAKIYAFKLPPIDSCEGGAPASGSPLQLNILDLAAKLGLPDGSIALEDIAVRPGTYSAYVALSVGNKQIPVIAEFRVDDKCKEIQGGAFKMLPLATLPNVDTDIEDLPTSDQLMFEPEPIQQYVITDMKYHAPEKSLYCTGLSSLTNASTMRIYEWPFLGSYKTKGLASFNVSHQQWESHAPIRHFDIMEVDLEQWGAEGERLGKQKEYCMVGALLCTPLVYLPLKELHACGEKDQVKTRTFAEIGSGGTPLGFVRFTAPGAPQIGIPPGDMIFIPSMYKNASNIPLDSIMDAINGSKNGIECPTKEEPWFDGSEQGDQRGIKQTLCGDVFRAACMQDLSEKNNQQIVVLRRERKTGKAQLVSMDTLTTNRLTDMSIEEYWWKSYEAKPDMFNMFIANIQNEGFPLQGYPNSQVKPVVPEGGMPPGGMPPGGMPPGGMPPGGMPPGGKP